MTTEVPNAMIDVSVGDTSGRSAINFTGLLASDSTDLVNTLNSRVSLSCYAVLCLIHVYMTNYFSINDDQSRE